MQDYEKLGVFYLGKLYDPQRRQVSDELVLYDSKDLVTHAVCIGMTGSGKTGLCISLLEEALIDGVPALIIDPKGDLANLMLTFPDLKADDFAPWINEEDARRKGMTAAEYAAAQAETWRNGLAAWDQNGDRIRRLRDAADVAIYTPGSSAGRPLAVLKSFAAPPAALAADAELLGDRISATATSLLALLGIDSDPLRSREHILIAKILESFWGGGRDVELAALVEAIQKPPIRKVGAIDVDTFFAPDDRFELAMRLNNLLAAPGFEAWMRGDALDIDSLLYTSTGKPRAAILSIAHLDDAERMFFVSLVLNEVIGWMRAQSGTTSLRAILYMDEIFGYFPPVANPPSKKPLLTLLKQARAFGLGVVLVTQNPVDLDYKGLSNAGTWFIGRLQTERDRERVLDGLASAASGAFDRSEIDRLLGALANRVFVMNNVHDEHPAIFHSRWALSYLRGPLTREQIRMLSGPAASASASAGPAAPSGAPAVAPATRTRPALSPQIRQLFAPLTAQVGPDQQLLYEGMLLGVADVHLTDGKLGIDLNRQVRLLAPLREDLVSLEWGEATELALPLDALTEAAPLDGAFAELPPGAADPKKYERWQSELKQWVYGNFRLELKRSPAIGLVARVDESERDFRIRLRDAAHELRDRWATQLREKYRPRMARLEERERRAQQAVERENAQADQHNWNAAISLGATVLNAFLGRRSLRAGTIGRATTAARSASRVLKERDDVTRAAENVEAIRSERQMLEKEFDDELAALTARTDIDKEELETVAVKPRKGDVVPRLVALVWLPYRVDANGRTERLG